MHETPAFEAPELEFLIKTLFHQDWMMEGSSASELLSRYVAQTPKDEIARARESAIRLANLGLNEEELTARLDALGLEYDPNWEGMTHHQWLELVITNLTSHLDGSDELAAP